MQLVILGGPVSYRISFSRKEEKKEGNKGKLTLSTQVDLIKIVAEHYLAHARTHARTHARHHTYTHVRARALVVLTVIGARAPVIVNEDAGNVRVANCI